MPRPSKRVKCDKCGEKFGHYGLPRHRKACTGVGRLGHKNGPMAKVKSKPKRKYTKREVVVQPDPDTVRELMELQLRTELATKILMGAI